MKSRILRTVFACACLVALAGLSTFAQGRPPGGGPGAPPPGGIAPGAPGGVMSPGGPGAQHPPAANANTASQGVRNGFQFGPAGRWWDDKSVIQTIGLRQDQKQRMDGIFSANKPAILNSYKAYLKEQSRLNALNKDSHVDQARVFAAIDAVNQARTSLQKATSQMLLQLRKEMNSEQIEKLEKMK
jgi:hypothetical protein